MRLGKGRPLGNTGKNTDVYGTGWMLFDVDRSRTCTVCTPFQSVVGPLSRGIEVLGLKSLRFYR